AFGVGIVKGVHDGDRLARTVAERRSRQAIRLLQIARVVAAGTARPVRVALLIDLDQSVTARCAAGSRPADLGGGGAQRLLNGSGLVICRRVIDIDCAGGEKDGESKRKNAHDLGGGADHGVFSWWMCLVAGEQATQRPAPDQRFPCSRLVTLS